MTKARGTDFARLDMLLVERGEYASRARAQAAIRAGLVAVEGEIARRPGMRVAHDADIRARGDAHPYVSRGGVKLSAALAAFAIDPKDRICLDLGASTGGFTDVLLRAGAAKVYAADVGRGQLHPTLAADRRIVSLEGTHARDLDRTRIPEPVDLLVCDVSFISLTKALPAALSLCAPGAALIALVKPQFELGPEKIGKGGIVRAEPAEIDEMKKAIANFLERAGWRVGGFMPSPIAGGDGNTEHLLCARLPT